MSRRPPRAYAAGLLLLVGLLVALVAAPSAAAAPEAPEDDAAVSLVLDGMTPRVVTADGPGELVVTGHVANRSAVPVRDLAVRLAKGSAVTGSRGAVDALDGDGATQAVRARVDAPSTVEPGQDAPFTLRVPLAGTDALAARTGVLPLRVEATGSLGGAGTSRLGAVPVLLPVVGVPGGRPATPPPADRAASISVLYPLADRPRRLPVVPGAPTLLADDDLATSFAPGGRLAGLVDALGRAAPAGSAAARSVCLAVDADLLETAQAMAGGYQVRTPDGGARPGAGAAAAGQWLDAVRAQARGRCVTALPYADTDLVATARGNLTDLTTAAVATGTRRVAELLGVTPVPDTVWPAGGLVDERSLADLTAGGTRNLLLDPDVLDGDPPAGALARLPGPAGAAPTAVTLDPVAAAALAPRTDEAVASPAGTPGALAAQDAVGALALRALQGPGTGSPPVDVVAPPIDWAANGAEAGALLGAVDELTRLGLARPVDLGGLLSPVGAGTPLPTASLSARSGLSEADGLQQSAVARAGQVRDRQRELLAATERDGVGAPSPSDFVEPLTDDVLRSLSAAWRGDPAAQDAAVGAVERQNDELRSLVRVVQPSGSYSLGSNDAPLLLTVENRLPVAVRVDVVLEPTNGLRTTPVPQLTVPAFGSRQVQVEVEVTRAGQFAVDARARTPGGEPLGPTARLLLRSTAYGTITVWLTASAALVLVILASVRIARRVRAARRDRRSRRSRHRGDPTTTDPQDLPTRELQKR
ncbi:hypothetical protein Acsp06_53090 [Actinomycetospora sp. NBRC 106375]|uniref:DUF6049 family protein n=1 Tax=Actinomycetospora sp. NBRC 106375 TaxID=3032207 RepID=UPI0024A34C46|nr:DUF6049 family protein [Actinomycetospora sp. NBRC 106375]GLZ49124.1 hypothetical protein Acsp06_53090 [Actinomycetospora sp. NBRC 106375]